MRSFLVCALIILSGCNTFSTLESVDGTDPMDLGADMGADTDMARDMTADMPADMLDMEGVSCGKTRCRVRVTITQGLNGSAVKVTAVYTENGVEHMFTGSFPTADSASLELDPVNSMGNLSFLLSADVSERGAEAGRLARLRVGESTSNGLVAEFWEEDQTPNQINSDAPTELFAASIAGPLNEPRYMWMEWDAGGGHLVSMTEGAEDQEFVDVDSVEIDLKTGDSRSTGGSLVMIRDVNGEGWVWDSAAGVGLSAFTLGFGAFDLSALELSPVNADEYWAFHHDSNGFFITEMSYRSGIGLTTGDQSKLAEPLKNVDLLTSARTENAAFVAIQAEAESEDGFVLSVYRWDGSLVEVSDRGDEDAVAMDIAALEADGGTVVVVARLLNSKMAGLRLEARLIKLP